MNVLSLAESSKTLKKNGRMIEALLSLQKKTRNQRRAGVTCLVQTVLAGVEPHGELSAAQISLKNGRQAVNKPCRVGKLSCDGLAVLHGDQVASRNLTKQRVDLGDCVCLQSSQDTARVRSTLLKIQVTDCQSWPFLNASSRFRQRHSSTTMTIVGPPCVCLADHCEHQIVHVSLLAALALVGTATV